MRQKSYRFKLVAFFLLSITGIAGCNRTVGDEMPELLMLDALNPPSYSLHVELEDYFGDSLTAVARPDYIHSMSSGPDSLTLAIPAGQSAATFEQKFRPTDGYEAGIDIYPYNPTQLCSLKQDSSPESGQFDGSDLTLKYFCQGAYRISGAIGGTDGLQGDGLRITEAGGDEVTPVAGDTGYEFRVPLLLDSAYDLKVAAQPTHPWQTCTFDATASTAHSGVWNSGDNMISDVSCTTNTYEVTLSITNLVYDGLQVQYNSEAPESIPGGSTSYSFGNRKSGSSYNVSIATQPSVGQECQVFGGSGTVEGSPITIDVGCSDLGYLIGGSVTGLLGSGLELDLSLDNTYQETLPVSSGIAGYHFNTEPVMGQNYEVTILSQPTGPIQNCTLSNGSGTVDGHVSNVDVSCTTATFSVGGEISGLESGRSVELTLTGTDASGSPHSQMKTITGDGSNPLGFTFPTEVEDTSTLSVSVSGQPSDQTCEFASGSTTVDGAPVTDLNINCGYTVSGKVTGLISGTVAFKNNAGEVLSQSTNGNFSFSNFYSAGTSYSVQVENQPSSLHCVVVNGAGTSTTNVTDVRVTCPVWVDGSSKKWNRCTSGQVWNSEAGDCSGIGDGTNGYGAQQLQWCSRNTNDCNTESDGVTVSDFLQPSSNWLNGESSEVWNACNSLAASSEFGIDSWRVPTVQEVQRISNNDGTAPEFDQTIFPNQTTADGMADSNYYYWTNEQATDSTVWAHMYRADGYTSGTSEKNGYMYLRCVAD